MSISSYAKENQMKINFRKTKCMVFNTGILQDFQPEFNVEGNVMKVVDEMRILGLKITSNMKWSANTEHILIKAFRKLWMLRR